MGYKESLNFAKNLKNQLDKKIKKLGKNSQDLLESVEFIIDREF